MEGFNGWLYESFNHDFAIRRFCSERVELEQVELEEAMNYDIDSCCPDDETTTPHLAASEVQDFVDSFFNMDNNVDVDNDGDGKDDHHNFEKKDNSDRFRDEIETFSIVNDDLMIEGDELERSDSCEDLGSHGIVPSIVEASHGVDQGLHLVHLLLACAEAVSCRDLHLATSMLTQICASATPLGDSLQRVSYCFAAGLKARLSLLQNVNGNGTITNCVVNVPSMAREEKSEAFHLLYQMTPYIAFGFMAANEAICQAAQGKVSLHVIDLGMEHTLQWPSLIRTLASRPEGPPTLRITSLTSNEHLVELEAGIKSLVEDASSLGITMEFHVITEPVTPSLLTTDNLNLREGESLYINSVMHLHKYVKESRGSLKAILQAIKKLSPALLTVVEQDANHNGPFFLGRFLESLHYYSAIFDSLEASLPRHSPQRMKIERLHFAEEIHNIVAYEGSDRIERHERADQWRRQLGRAGFHVMGLKCLSQARMMLSVYSCDGYTLGSEKGCLLLGWKGRPLMLASAWQLHNASS
ncbi:nuclear transcription factor Y subunit C-9-like isoform 1 [Hibiscus syriacus]|uniref:Nuclear transcription factor Y subunit C-9-like isoform 1 n=1 Tax=Hibiscus syriacus TaxID=106335 RepID=A0A6A3AJL2_HIBSY|nr:GRAS family protein RAD1-like [Hibiscus syriacus]KAE8704258.1 nuclear transcription factor Y subunit C-9-like isoform 1 [Hibiscus syriacus]